MTQDEVNVEREAMGEAIMALFKEIRALQWKVKELEGKLTGRDAAGSSILDR